MESVKYITLGGFDFIITNEIDFNGNHYMLAIDEKGEDTVVVLKQRFIDGKEVVESVQDDDEMELVFELINKQQNEGNI